MLSEQTLLNASVLTRSLSLQQASRGALSMMQRAGYTSVAAGAIEAVASTGGQLMPPVMGAAAFLMAEFLEVNYTEIMVAALLPSLLYYLSVFVQADLIAARDNIRNAEGELPRVTTVLRGGWHLLVPFAVLIFALSHLEGLNRDALV